MSKKSKKDSLINYICLKHNTTQHNTTQHNTKLTAKQFNVPHIKPDTILLNKFKKELLEFVNKYINNTQNKQNEEDLKNKIKDLLTGSLYTKDKFDIVFNEGRIDLGIKSKSYEIKDFFQSIFEIKHVKNKSEFIDPADINKKALHELIYYFYIQKFEKRNKYIKSLITTNGLQWYIFLSDDFKSEFVDNCELCDNYKRDKKYAKYNIESETKDFYNDAERYINNNEINLKCIYLDISKIDDNTSDDTINEIYNLLSPRFLLGEKNDKGRDANAINKNFYNELLYIIGYEEDKDKHINRKEEGKRENGSLVELAIEKLEDLPNIENKENIAFELCITWINRLLFIKLLDEQIYKYKKEKFLNSSKIGNFDELEKLFFKVLGTPISDRSNDIKQKYSQVPYLNSSLFEFTELENKLRISSLTSDHVLDYYKSTSLKDRKKEGKELNTLEYLLEFLESYNFGSGEDSKDPDKIINASILGRIFEKLNGYEDGAYFTPSNITTYMSKDALERVVVQKFNDTYNFECASLIDLYNELNSKENIKKIKDYNNTFNSIRICDPAVGSGHFLVSVLNELIRIKWYLQILCDADGKKFANYDFEIIDDELVIKKGNERISYDYQDKESQRLQETLFHEKRTLIENCLFGVDINPNSVNICRLRLWIELLKNSYYKKESNYTELETLPNIDINIKQGDSLLNKLPIKGQRVQSEVFETSQLDTIKELITNYKKLVEEYKNTNDKNEKSRILEIIKEIKEIKLPQVIKDDSGFRGKNKKEEYYFEWRTEFPEVLDNEGNFEGFDLIIGNPPYIGLKKIKDNNKELGKLNEFYADIHYEVLDKEGDIYCLFYERGMNLLKENGILAYITSNKWMKVDYGEKLRKYLSKYNVLELIDLGANVFEDAKVDTNILLVQKNEDKSNHTLYCDYKQYKIKDLDNINFVCEEFSKDGSIWLIESEIKKKIKNKVISQSRKIRDIVQINEGINSSCINVFIIDKSKRDEILNNCSSEDEYERTNKLLRPVLKGECIKRYSINYHNLYLVNTHNGVKKSNIERIKIENYPAVKEYLEIYYKDLEKRTAKGDTPYNLRNCAFLENFDKEKIIYPDINNKHFHFYLDNSKYIIDYSAFILTNKHLGYLTAFLNSNLFYYCYKDNFITLGDDSFRAKKTLIMKTISVKDVSDEKDEKFKKLVYEIQDKKKNNEDTTELEAQIDNMIFELYDLTDEEIEEVEKEVKNSK